MTHACKIALLAAVLPMSLLAQTNPSNTVNPALLASVAPSAPENAPPTLSATLSTFALSAPHADALPSAAGSAAPAPPPPADQPPIEGSMVGYIDDAIVGSNARLRFDSAFDDNAPDRAEFFYAQCGCDGGTAKGPKPGLATALNFQQLYLRDELAFKKRLSFVVDLPIRWLQPQKFAPLTVSPSAPGFGNQTGISDLQIGLKFAMLASPRQYLTLQFMAILPTGASTQGLGTAHYSIVPSLLYFQKVTDRLSVESQLGVTQPLGSDTPGFSGGVFDYGVGPSFEVYRSEHLRIAPVIELVGWYVLGGMENNAALLGVVSPPLQSVSGTSIVNMKAGFRTSFGKNSIYAGFGQALTHDIWYKHIVRVEYRLTF
jgi:hypothetical protein